jgi:K+-sensing histidine kinase KdpD
MLAAREKMKSERMRTELITNVSHDIKTPLTSLINYVDLLQKPHTQAEGEQYLEVQGGAMEVFVDGDLFKVTLSLPCS